MDLNARHAVSETSAQTPTKRGTVSIIGLGYVGLPLAILAEEKGYRVVGFDIDASKVSELKKRRAAFLSEEEKRSFRRSRMQVRTDEAYLPGADAHIVCVPTPVHEDHTPDLQPLIDACTIVGRNLRRGALVVIESTVNPGACEEVALPILERESGLTVEEHFYFAHCPERINPGDPSYTVRTIPRVMGATGTESMRRALALYQSIIEADIVPMESIKEAEAVKMVENAFRDINIAFVNELAMSFSKVGIDILNVIKGASTKPFSFMPHYPGCGVGGHCIPVDPYYLIKYGKQNGFEHRFLIAAREINNGMPQYTVDLLEKTLQEKNQLLRGAKVALLGLAYKRDVPDLRESPALQIREELLARGANVQSFDPLTPLHSSAATLEEALRGADAVLIATDHSLFRSLTPEMLHAHGVTVVVDGRNCLSKKEFQEAGIAYRGIGRR